MRIYSLCHVAAALLLPVSCAHSPPASAPAEGGGSTVVSAAATTGNPFNGNNDLAKLFDDYYEESLALDPLLASMLGDHRYDDHLAIDISDAYRGRIGEMSRRYLARLQLFSPAELGADERLSHELLRRELSERLESLSFPEHLLALTQLSGQPVDFPVTGSGGGVHTFATAADYQHFLGRIEDFVTWVDTAIANLRVGVSAGIVHPLVVIDKLVPQLDAQIVDDATKSVFYQPLRQPPATLVAADRARFDTEYRKAISTRIVPAYRRLRDFLVKEYRPRCRASIAFEQLPNGRPWYAFRVRTSITAATSPDDIFKLGEAEVARIEREMLRLRDEAGFKGTLASFAHSVGSGRAGGFATRSALVSAYDSLRKGVLEALPSLFGRLPKAGFEIRPVEKFREESAPSQYQPPSPDGSRPGVFYVNAAKISRGAAAAVSETLFLHEALPGHHFQIALQYENTNLPRFRRLLGYNAYVEGWALYAESLGSDIGLFRDPPQALEHLGAEMLRAVRLAIDTGIHHRGWTRQRALAYYKAHVISISEDVSADAVREVDRYIAWPGQALGYKMGQLKIAELRARVAAQLGGRFDVRAFHDEVLRNGPLPLDLLEAHMREWAEARLNGAS